MINYCIDNINDYGNQIIRNGTDGGANSFKMHPEKMEFKISNGYLRPILKSYKICLPNSITFRSGDIIKIKLTMPLQIRDYLSDSEYIISNTSIFTNLLGSLKISGNQEDTYELSNNINNNSNIVAIITGGSVEFILTCELQRAYENVCMISYSINFMSLKLKKVSGCCKIKCCDYNYTHNQYSNVIRVDVNLEITSGFSGLRVIEFGNPIIGDIEGGQFGFAVALNDIGDIIAGGAPTTNLSNGLAQTYVFREPLSFFINTDVVKTWNKLGNDITGTENNETLGYSVSLNGSGNIMAVGSKGADVEAGFTQIFTYDTNTDNWILMGSAIEGENQYDADGACVSLNNSGDRVAIVGLRSSESTIGHVRVFEYDSNNWNVLGGDVLDGFIGSTDDEDFYGITVCSISGDGTRVIIGAPINDGNGSVDALRGRVRVYQYNGSSWVQIGSDINGLVDGELFGTAVAINNNGTKILVGAPGVGKGVVRRYEYNFTDWIKITPDIEGENEGELFGSSVAMNAEGDLIASGAPLGNGTISNSGSVLVYDEELNQKFMLYGDQTNSKYGTSLDFNKFGNILTVSAPNKSILDELNRGSIYSYDVRRELV